MTQDLPYRACVGLCVFNREGKVFAGRRIPQGYFLDQSHLWQLPQGGIDHDEAPLQAALRELWEETGIKSVSLLREHHEWLYYDLPLEVQGKALKGLYRGQKQRWFAFLFEGDEREINIHHPADGHKAEFDAWGWKNLHEMPELVVPFKQNIYQELGKVFADIPRSLSFTKKGR